MTAETTALDAAQRRSLWTGLAAFLVTTMFWGANLPLTTILLRAFDPFWLTLWRLVLATTALAAVVWVSEGRAALRVGISWPRFVLLGLSLSAFFIDYNLALRFTNTITAAAVMAGAPIYAVITLWLVTRAPAERGLSERDKGCCPAERGEAAVIVGPIITVVILVNATLAREQRWCIEQDDRHTRIRQTTHEEPAVRQFAATHDIQATCEIERLGIAGEHDTDVCTQT